MRFEQMPLWASNPNYATGAKVGTPTRIRPTAGIIADGHLPNRPPGAQWENWRDYEVTRRVAALQELGVTQWSPATLSVEPDKIKRADFAGLTYYISTANVDSVYVVRDVYLDASQKVVLPTANAFTPRDVAVSEVHESVVLVGATGVNNLTAWVAKNGVQDFTEIDTGISQLRQVVCDEANGDLYAIGSDLDEPVIKSTDGGLTWTLAGHKEGSSPQPNEIWMRTFAAHDGQLLHIDQSGTRYSLNGGVTWQDGINLSPAAFVTDVAYSDIYGVWIVTTASGRCYTSANVAGPWTLAADFGFAVNARQVAMPVGFAGTNAGPMGWPAISYSIDGGQTFRWTGLHDTHIGIRFDGYCLWAGSGTTWRRAALIR